MVDSSTEKDDLSCILVSSPAKFQSQWLTKCSTCYVRVHSCHSGRAELCQGRCSRCAKIARWWVVGGWSRREEWPTRPGAQQLPPEMLNHEWIMLYYCGLLNGWYRVLLASGLLLLEGFLVLIISDYGWMCRSVCVYIPIISRERSCPFLKGVHRMNKMNIVHKIIPTCNAEIATKSWILCFNVISFNIHQGLLSGVVLFSQLSHATRN